MEESVTRRQNHGRICNMKKNSCKNLSQEKKITEEYVTSRNSQGKISHKKIKSWKNMSQKEKIMG